MKGNNMKPNKTDLQQAFELLIQCLEKHTFCSRFEKETILPKEDTLTVGNIIVKYSDLGQRELSARRMEFSMIFAGELLYRGIIGYMPILYTKQNQKFGEELLDDASVGGIITIHHSAYSYSQIAIILFDRNGPLVWFASCHEVKDAVFFLMGENPEGVSVYYSEKVYPENLLPEYYNEDQSIIDAALHNTQTKRLEELAEIIPGKSARSYDYRDSGIPYLRARDIQKGVIVTASVCLEPAMATEFSRQLLQEGDILLTKHFGQRKLALVSEENLPAIASEALFIIRPFGISERYLYRYLISKTGNAVFNAQLKRIERGTTVASIALSDLKRIQVPVYDEDTMLDYEQMDQLTGEDGLEAALRIIQSVGEREKTESDIEKHVFAELVSAGWEAEKLSSQDGLVFENGKRWIPDLSYCLPDNTKVYFEVKRTLSRASSEWASAIARILMGSTKCYYVLTTGFYYEVHVTGREKSLKLLHAPTIPDILDWERGQN